MAFIAVTVAIDGSSGCSILLHILPRSYALESYMREALFIEPGRSIQGPMNSDLGFDYPGEAGHKQKLCVKRS